MLTCFTYGLTTHVLSDTWLSVLLETAPAPLHGLWGEHQHVVQIGVLASEGSTCCTLDAMKKWPIVAPATATMVRTWEIFHGICYSCLATCQGCMTFQPMILVRAARLLQRAKLAPDNLLVPTHQKSNSHATANAPKFTSSLLKVTKSTPPFVVFEQHPNSLQNSFSSSCFLHAPPGTLELDAGWGNAWATWVRDLW